MNEQNKLFADLKPQTKTAIPLEAEVGKPLSIITNEDCMEMMSRYENKFFELAVVDPPYGIGIAKNLEKNLGGTESWKKHQNKEWDASPPSQEYFIELERVSQNQIIFGANYFIYNLPSISKGWIIWDKTNYQLTMSDCEIIYTSFNCKTRLYRENFGEERGVNSFYGDIHPTQKSTKIYGWIFMNYAKAGDKILDTHLGSGSSRIAAWKAKLDFYGCELDKDYYEAQEERFKKFVSQLTLW